MIYFTQAALKMGNYCLSNIGIYFDINNKTHLKSGILQFEKICYHVLKCIDYPQNQNKFII